MEDQECSGKKSKRFKEMKEGEVPGTMMRPTRCDSVTSIVSPKRQRERKLDEFGREEMKGGDEGSGEGTCWASECELAMFLGSAKDDIVLVVCGKKRSARDRRKSVRRFGRGREMPCVPTCTHEGASVLTPVSHPHTNFCAHQRLHCVR
jgi:hypothetical protein